MLSEHGLQVAPSAYYDHLEKPLTAWGQRDRQLKLNIAGVHPANYGVYGAPEGLADVEPATPGRCGTDRAVHRGAADG